MKYQRTHSSIQSRESGLSLVEMIVVVAIFSIISLAVFNSIAALYKYNAYTIAQAYQVYEARRGMEVLVRDLREMIYADDGAYPLVTMSDNEVAFYSDIDRDDSVEYVEYVLNGTTLNKYVYNADANATYPAIPDETYIVSDYVQNINQGTTIFTYYDENGDVAGAGTTVTDIQYISARIIVNIDPLRDPGEFTLRSSAALRNITESL